MRALTRIGLPVAVVLVAAALVLVRCRRELPPRALAHVWAVGDGDDLERDGAEPPQTSPVWDGQRVRLFAAGNEIVAFQLMVRAGAPGIKALRAELPGLRHPVGHAITYRPPAADPSDYRGRPIHIFTVNYQHVEEPTRADFIYTPDGADAPADPEGWKAVQLVPENARPGRGGWPVAVAPGDNQAIWIEIDTGRAPPAGVYHGQVTVSADGERVVVPIELEVFDFVLPDENSLTAMVYYETDQTTLYHGRDVDAAYHRFAHRQRIELVSGYDRAAVEAVLGRFDGRDFTPGAGYEGPGQGVGNRVVPASFYGPGPRWEDRAQRWRHADEWLGFLGERLPRAITFLYLPDEPSDDVFPEIHALTSHLRGNPGPGRRLPTLVTHEPTQGLAGAVDIWCATPPKIDLAVAARERAAGRQLWMYNGGRPHGPAIVIDAPASDARVIGWQTFRAGIPVYFYWNAVHWQHNHQKRRGPRNQNVWASPITFDTRNTRGRGELANGDGVLIYPGTDVLHADQDRGLAGPVGTVQLANLRRGLQDHLYLSLAAARGHQALVDEVLTEIVPRVFSDARPGDRVSFPEESAPFERARLRLGRALAGSRPR